MLNYQSVVERIESFSNHSPNVTLQTVARIAELPIFFLQVLPANLGQSMPKILISAGIHGDEPAGVEAILTFLEQHLPRWRDQFHFDVFPCLNPFGFSHNLRENSDGIDINRTFEDEPTVEARAVQSVLEHSKYDLFIEFHEDWEYDGFYLFELNENRLQLGESITSAVSLIGKLHQNALVDEYRTSKEAVLRPTPEVRVRGPMPVYLFKRKKACRTITCETPSSFWSMSKRVDAHLKALTTALDCLLKENQYGPEFCQ